MEWGYIFSCRLSSFLFARWYHYRPSWAWFLWCHADRQRWPFPFVLTRGPFAEQACSWTCSRSSLSTELTEDPESCMVLTWIWNNKKGVDGKMLSLLCWSAWFNVNRSLEDESMLHFFSVAPGSFRAFQKSFSSATFSTYTSVILMCSQARWQVFSKYYILIRCWTTSAASRDEETVTPYIFREK